MHIKRQKLLKDHPPILLARREEGRAALHCGVQFVREIPATGKSTACGPTAYGDLESSSAA